MMMMIVIIIIIIDYGGEHRTIYSKGFVCFHVYIPDRFLYHPYNNMHSVMFDLANNCSDAHFSAHDCLYLSFF